MPATSMPVRRPVGGARVPLSSPSSGSHRSGSTSSASTCSSAACTPTPASSRSGAEQVHPVAEQLAAVANPDYAEAMARYFQVRLGGYGEGDVFIGIRLRDLRAVAKPYAKISYRSEDWLPLIQSKVQTSPAGAVDHGRACPARHRGGTEQDIPRLCRRRRSSAGGP